MSSCDFPVGSESFHTVWALVRPGLGVNPSHFETAAHCRGISPQSRQSKQMPATAQQRFQARHGWRLCAHTLGNLRLDESSLFAGLQQLAQDLEFRAQGLTVDLPFCLLPCWALQFPSLWVITQHLSQSAFAYSSSH
jgi:hypothetical protein